jgi:uncharacterized protein (TIGR03663 family)
MNVTKKYNFFKIGTIFLIIFLCGLCIRILFPELRLLHIDEAIHAWMSYELWVHGTYIYNPAYHGPLLYYIMAVAYSLCGDTNAIIRLVPATAGSLLILGVYALYKLSYISKNQSIIVALFIAFSPNLVYFSRFLRHDIFQLLFTLLLLVCIFAYIERKKWYFALFSGFCAGCALCLKEEVPAMLCLFLVFFCIMWLLGKVELPTTWPRDMFIAILAVIAISCIFYTSFFSHPEIFLNAAHMGLTHWLGIQKECRLCGPPYWYFLMLILYELPILLIGIASALIWFVNKGTFRIVQTGTAYLKTAISKKQYHLPHNPGEKKEFFFTLCLWWLIGSMVFYGFINEKVPWLLIHQLLPLIFVASYVFQDINWKKASITVFSLLYLILMMIHVAFIPVAALNEPIVQVQNSEHLRDVMTHIDNAEHVAIVSEYYWPFPWYYRDLQRSSIDFYGSWIPPEDLTDQIDQQFDLIIAHGAQSYPYLDGYTKITYQGSYWFSWDNVKNQALRWFFLRNGEVGYDWYDVFIKT